MLGGARSATRTGRLRAPYPVSSYILPGGPKHLPTLHSSAFRIFQRQLELTRQRLDGCPLPLPRALGLEPQVADAAYPRGDDASDRAVVATVGVILIKSANDVRGDAYERAQRGRRLDGVLPASPRGPEHHRDLLEVVDEEP